jgi:hypothetical protein
VADRRRGLARRLTGLTLVAVLAAALLAVTLAACGSSGGGSEASDDPLVGYWIGAGKGAQMTMLQIKKEGDTYTVLSNPDQSMGEVKQEGGDLVVDTHVVEVRISSLPQDKLRLEFTGEMFKTPQTMELSRVDQQQYKDGAVAYGLVAIRRGLAMWKAGGGKEYPPAKEVMPDGMLAKMISWPVNLFTNGPMVQDASTGNFFYAPTDGGKDYSLKAYLSDGSTIGR